MSKLSMTREEREQFLSDVRIGVLAIADGERGPLACPVWYAYEPGGEVQIVTDPGSRKGKALRAASRASLVVQTEDMPYKYVSIEGPIAISDADLEKHLRPIARRYLGTEGGDGYVAMAHPDGESGILVTIRPERWLTVDYAKEFGEG